MNLDDITYNQVSYLALDNLIEQPSNMYKFQ